VTFAFIEAEKAGYSVRALCRALGVSPSGFYAARCRPASPRQRTDQQLRVHLRACHTASRGTYGSPRLQRDLRALGWRVGRHRVMRLMRAEQLRGRMRRRFRGTTTPDPAATPAPNLVAQDFTVTRRNQVWAADITALPTTEGWLYLAVLLDLWSRKVVGWAVDPTLETRLVVAAWQMAVTRRRAVPRVHHSDRGTQYTSARYQAALRQHGVRCSMSRRGNCYDNAVVESFFRTLKTEIAARATWPTRRAATTAVADYIDNFYNSRRRHSTINYQSPAAFERRRRTAA
jgi:putative transposase